MIYTPELLDHISEYDAVPWTGTVYRHMINDYPPDRPNVRGARWNPPEVAAIYSSLERSTALAEAEYRLNAEPYRLRIERKVYAINIKLDKVLDLGSMAKLEKLGIGEVELGALDYSACQQVGGAVAWLGHDGMLVPSARSRGLNLVIYQFNQGPTSLFEVLSVETIGA